MTDSLKISLAQINVLVGDVDGNVGIITDAIAEARDRQGADLVLLPELAVCGYPPEDLIFQSGLRRRIQPALEKIAPCTKGIAAFVGFPEYVDDSIYNSAALFDNGELVGVCRKRLLPNYSVFDEERYFANGEDVFVADINGATIGFAICEDLWEPEVAADLKRAGAQLLASINGSPFKRGKLQLRATVMSARCRETGLPVVYQNLIGGQDELVFDGGSAVYASDGSVAMRAPEFVEGVFPVAFSREKDRLIPQPGTVEAAPADVASVYSAIVLGVRDYVRKNGFRGIVLGLSGGVDSALTLAIAVDALGPKSVQAVMMPYRYTADISIEDAGKQAKLLEVDYQVIPIAPLVDAANESLADMFAGLAVDATEENIQSRARGLLLMAISNKTGRMVLATGNKSEMAVGYATLYGDMNGGFAPIKDCTKTLVYELAEYRNGISPAIPERVITRPPSAELAPDQQDSDTLPPYDILDPILDALMLDNCSSDEIVARGFERATVDRVLHMVRKNEYKRRQAAPGVRISSRAFGRDWRYPITNAYK